MNGIHDLEHEMHDYVFLSNDEFNDLQYDYSLGTVQTFNQLVDYCIWPSLQSLYNPVGILLICCILFRICCQYVEFNGRIKHSTSIALGLYVINYYFDFELLCHILGMASLSFCALSVPNWCIRKVVRIEKGPLALYCTLTYMTLNELYAENEKWNRIRSAEMLIGMKFISLAFDRGCNSIKPTPGFIEVFGYLLCPSTCIFGPWISFDEYLLSIQRIRTNWLWIGRIFSSLFLSFGFFLLSNCIVTWILPDTLPGLLLMYRDALVFRTSHYFVSFLSDATNGISGAGSSQDRPLVRVTNPHLIEIPRSMVEVCVYWNIAMHKWLKKYVFKPTFQKYGSLTAVLMTYFMSSLLHGLNARLSAVLLSLGFYTYVEYKTRASLAKLFSACVGSRPCPKPCNQHLNCDGKILVNVCYTVSVLLHLAYLGALMDVDVENSSLARWNDCYFFSHIMAIAEFCLYLVIKKMLLLNSPQHHE